MSAENNGALAGLVAVNLEKEVEDSYNTDVDVKKETDVKVEDSFNKDVEVKKTETEVEVEDSFNKKSEVDVEIEDSFNKKETEVEIEDSFNKKTEIDTDIKTEIEDSFNKKTEIDTDVKIEDSFNKKEIEDSYNEKTDIEDSYNKKIEDSYNEDNDFIDLDKIGKIDGDVVGVKGDNNLVFSQEYANSIVDTDYNFAPVLNVAFAKGGHADAEGGFDLDDLKADDCGNLYADIGYQQEDSTITADTVADASANVEQFGWHSGQNTAANVVDISVIGGNSDNDYSEN